jgi:hypothetical protein
MTKGILLFAHDNEQIHYSLLAVWQARRIQHWLNVPVAIVTDQQSLDNLKTYNINPNHEFDKIILSNVDTDQKKDNLTFKNVDRTDAYELTPYDETLVIDTDIVIQSNRLNVVWNNAEDYLVCEHCTDTLGRDWPGLKYVNPPYGIKFYWATLFYFKKNNRSKEFFNLCKHIKENYRSYNIEYKIGDSYLRNDHVWSIAIHKLGATSIPTNLWYSINKDVVKMNNQAVVVENTIKIAEQDVHVMNKHSLMEYVKKELDV